MKLNVKHTAIDMTPALMEYLETKLGSVSKYIKRFDEDGAAELWVEIARTTKHHHKGDVFRAEVDLRLPGKILRAEEDSDDLRAAVDTVREKLILEIEKYKTRFVSPKRRGN